MQICSCLENIYFLNHALDCVALYKKAKPFLRKDKTRTTSFPPSTEQEHGEYITTSREDVRTNLSLSFLGIKKSAKKWRDQFKRQPMQKAAIVRDQQLCEDYKEYFEALDLESEKKQFSLEDAFEFVLNKRELK